MLIDLTIEPLTTPIGDMLLVSDSKDVLYAADFADHHERLHHLLNRRIGIGRYNLVSGQGISTASTALSAYFGGDLAAINHIPVEMKGTPFQEQVWCGLRTIIAGQTLSYGAFAALLGRPEAARAVGHANGANPFNVIIPCHRLVAGNGALTGYAGGLERKRWLIDHESGHK